MATKKTAATATTPPLFGRVREIVEEAQKGKRRAGYGAALLADLAARLKMEFGAGYGVDNLELCRRFYLEYPGLLAEQISDAMRRKSDRTPGTAKNSEAVRRNFEIMGAASALPATPGQLNANLSWTHYRRLLHVGRSDAREFYEIEAIRNAWSARELENELRRELRFLSPPTARAAPKTRKRKGQP